MDEEIPQLTTGVCDQIASAKGGHPVWTSSPVMQIVQAKMIEASGQPRWRVVISDGVHVLQAMVTVTLNSLFVNGDAQKGSIVRLQRFETSKIRERSLVIISSFEILAKEAGKIGNPTPHTLDPPAVSGNRKSSKVHIPHTEDEGCNIVGILEQLDADGDTQGRPIALLLHGSMGHKDYVYQKRLAQQLPIDSFRFDFRGNHETPAQFTYGDFDSDIADVEVVVKYLTSKHGYVVTMIVSHSKASMVTMRYLCTSKEVAANVRCFVNVAGRYRMKVDHNKLFPGLYESFETLGYHEHQATIAREPKTFRIYPEDIEAFCSWDTSIVWDKFPHHIHVLTVHGIQDTRIPVYDAVLYSRAFGNRSPGTHNLCLIEDADHNFTRLGNRETVVETILKWYEAVHNGECKTGVWETGVRPRL